MDGCRTSEMARVAAAVLVLAALGAVGAEPFRSPCGVAYSPDGGRLAVSDRTAASLVLLDAAARKTVGAVALNGKPEAVAWVGGKIYVAEYDAGTVAEVDAAAGKVARRMAVGPKPVGVAVAAKRGVLLAADYGLGVVVVVDLAGGKETRRIRTLGQPYFVAVSPDETLAAVGHLSPEGNATQTGQASSITILDLATLEKAAEIALVSGCTNVRGITFSPDGKWIYVVHTLGRFTLPTTQLDRGWINTNAMTILDAAGRQRHATVLFDLISSGAADPWGVAVSPDGRTGWVTLAGAQELAEVRLDRLHALLAGQPVEPDATKGPATIWAEIAKDPARREGLANDLAALYTAGVTQRHALPGNGPRGVAVSPDGKQVAVASYYSGEVTFVDPAAPDRPVQVAVGAQPASTPARRGEMAFHDGTLCFQKWLSCATCHPDGRADGLNWDLLNDGMGNPKNTKSLVWSDRTPPAMALGVRASMDMATEKGFHFIQFRVVGAETLADVRGYLGSLEPEASPYLVNGKLSAKAEQGRKLFEDSAVGCAKCHPGPLYTDLKMYDVGTSGELDGEHKEFDNPTCIEMWRTAPYLHDGSSPTLELMLTTGNKAGKHGSTTHLKPEQIEALAEYLRSL